MRLSWANYEMDEGLLRVWLKLLRYPKHYYLLHYFFNPLPFGRAQIYKRCRHWPLFARGETFLCSAMLEVLYWASHKSLGQATPCKSEYPEGSEYVRHTTASHTPTIFGTEAEKMQRPPMARHFRQTLLGTAPAIMTKNVIFSTFSSLVNISVTIFNPLTL